MLHDDPIDPTALVTAVTTPDHGAVATFIGVVRNQHAGRAVLELTYSAYERMARSVMADIVAEAEGSDPVRVAVAHRLGRLAVGDVAVVVAVGAGHRDAAFRVCRWVIDEIKARVPIWKLERYADGSEAWVDPTAPDGVVPADRPA
jgi:molybdopterin synthase catalytic subunit